MKTELGRFFTISASAVLAVVLGPWMAGCSSDESAPRQAPSAASVAPARPTARSRLQDRPLDAAARIPIEQARGVVVMSDPQRRAKAFENGLVGRPAPSTADESPPTLQVPQCNPEDEPCGPEPKATVTATAIAPDKIKVTFTCGEDANTLVRTRPDSKTVSTDCIPGTMFDTGLSPGTRYCYAMQNSDGSIGAGPDCATTLWNPYVFHGPGISQAESDQMIASFDWTRTDPVAVTIPTSSGYQTALYSMNILVQNRDDLYAIRALGIHTQTHPLLPGEQDDSVWDGSLMKAMLADKPAGVWITAIVPGPIYNDLRSQAIAGIASGNPIGIKAMVFRRINDPDAAVYADPAILVNPLNPTFLGEQGIEFNGYSPKECYEKDGVEYCRIEQAIFGWAARKLISIAVDIVEAFVHGVRQIFGAITRKVFGEVDVTVQLLLLNTDEGFGRPHAATSGWNAGAPLVLRGLKVRAYQGVAEFTATTDDNGVATLHVAKDREGKVCIDLDNSRLTIIDNTFTERSACIGHFPETNAPIVWPMPTNNRFANQLAAMTDAADYMQTVMGVNMDKVSVVTGWQSKALTSLNGGRSFTPCMGRMPNLTANLAIYALPDLLTAIGEILEFLAAFDIVMADGDVNSRGVGVHEYGHAAMCELLRQASQVDASNAWADVIVASLTGQDASSQQAVIAEGFADFLALQVVGGTNYFAGSNTQFSRDLRYCKGDSPVANHCVEANSQRCDGAGCAFGDNVRWAASLLQDAFDRIPFDAAEQANPSVSLPNDGSHWMVDAGGTLVPHHASNQVSAFDSDTIQLAGEHISNIFSAWSDSASVLRYDSFFGGLARALMDDGFDVNAACAMFAAHEPTGTCPGYVTDVYGTQPTPPPPPNPNGIRFAYALADQPTRTSYEPSADFAFNGTGGEITINRIDTGRYRVTFDGLQGGPNLSTSVSVTAFGSSTITCSVADLASTQNSSDVSVVCWDNALTATADSGFSIMVLGDSVMPAPSAFLESGGSAPLAALDPRFNWTSGRHPQAVTHNASAGDYNVILGVGNAPLSAKLVTPHGANGGERCNIAAVISGGLELKCYDRAAAPADGRFYTVQVAGGRPGQRFGFAMANNASAASYTPLASTSFNSSGGAITITHPSAGRYVANFAGLQKQAGHSENVQVTAMGGGLTTCNAVDWSNSVDGLQVTIECRNGALQLANTRYEVMVIE